VVSRSGGNQFTVPFAYQHLNAGANLRLIFVGTPVAGETYSAEVIVVG
jgi:hypothetical protein